MCVDLLSIVQQQMSYNNRRHIHLNNVIIFGKRVSRVSVYECTQYIIVKCSYGWSARIIATMRYFTKQSSNVTHKAARRRSHLRKRYWRVIGLTSVTHMLHLCCKPKQNSWSCITRSCGTHIHSNCVSSHSYRIQCLTKFDFAGAPSCTLHTKSVFWGSRFL